MIHVHLATDILKTDQRTSRLINEKVLEHVTKKNEMLQ